jgi:uncharacterized membrane protein YhaH (DUF805 family)
MLHNILGFGGRMGRLEYFLSCMALGVLVGLLVIALTAGFAPHITRGEKPVFPLGFIVGMFVVVLPITLWFSLAFEAKRLRDMGWNPLYFIPISFAVFVTLEFAARVVPALALVNGLLNLAQCLCLLFWPSQPMGSGDWYGGSYGDGFPEPLLDRTPSSPPRRPATVRTSAPPPVFTPAPSGFGRRGL